MIEINLLPQELRKKVQKVEFNKQTYFNIIILVVSLFVVIHILLVGVFMLKKAKFNRLNTAWPKLEKDLEEITDIKNEIKNLSQDNNKITEVIENEGSVAYILNKLSLELPNGIWFRYLKLDENEFIIEGSVVSQRAVDETTILNKYLTSLKAQKEIKIFENLEIADIKKKNIQSIQVADFILRVKLK